jgi:hypothetical protein
MNVKGNITGQERISIANLYEKMVMKKSGVMETGTSSHGMRPPDHIGKQAPIKLPPSVKQTPKAMIGAKPVKPSGKVQDYEGGYKDWKKAQDNYKMELKEWKTQKTNDKRAEQINAAGAAAKTAATPSSPTIINAPTSNVSSNKTDITSTSKSLVNPNPIVEKLNAM